MSQGHAIQRSVRQSPRKMRLVIDLIRHQDVNEAYAILKFNKKHAAKQIAKTLKSAVDRVTMAFGGPGPTPQIEPQRMVHGLAPPAVLEFALDQARALVAADVMAALGGR